MEKILKYKSFSDWVKHERLAYLAARKHGIIEKIYEIFGEKITKKPGYWTKEKCIEEAKKYTTKNAWRIGSKSSYTIAYAKKWLDDCCIHMTKINKRWTKEKCIEEAKKYSSRSQWSKNSGSSYNFAKKHCWFDECCLHMILKTKPKGYWTKERCIEEAKKYKSTYEWQNNNGSSYKEARINNWLNECCLHMISLMKPTGYWTKERCIEEAKKYKTRKEWQKNSSGSLDAARKKGWYSECIQYIELVCKRNYWTKERCTEEAKKYNRRVDWYRNQGSSYGKAQRNGWLDECCKHMNKETFVK